MHGVLTGKHRRYNRDDPESLALAGGRNWCIQQGTERAVAGYRKHQLLSIRDEVL